MAHTPPSLSLSHKQTHTHTLFEKREKYTYLWNGLFPKIIEGGERPHTTFSLSLSLKQTLTHTLFEKREKYTYLWNCLFPKIIEAIN